VTTSIGNPPDEQWALDLARLRTAITRGGNEQDLEALDRIFEFAAQGRRMHALPTAPAWIAVTQEPDAPVPDKGETVLFRTADWPGSSSTMGKLNDETGMWESEETDDDGDPRWSYGRFEVSHFMRIPKAPLPAPPERTEP
jgi:hypothetical protein